MNGHHCQNITEKFAPRTSGSQFHGTRTFDHLFEHLAPSDRMIMATRRRLLEAARALAEHGTVPPGVDEPAIMYPVRSGDFVTDARLGWRECVDYVCAA